MSVKAMSLVWDLECPKLYGGIEFRHTHKFVLLAYADHADHQGRNIWPAVHTIAIKTGFQDRSIQRLTNDLETIGFLIEDGKGPRGSNRWRLPFNEKGDSLSPRQSVTLTDASISLGDSALGDSALGDSVSPELKEPEPKLLISLYNNPDSIWDDTKAQLRDHFKRAQYITWIEPTQAGHFDGTTLHVLTSNSAARKWLNDNAQRKAQELLGVYVTFVIAEPEDAEALRS